MRERKPEVILQDHELRDDVWFTSDNHFGHKGILEFCPNTREGSNVDEMDQIMIERWNSVVKKGDRVYCTGDLMFHSKKDKIHTILKQLNGSIHLIRGNHCYFAKDSHEFDGYFASISDYKEIQLDKIKICMFHYPQVEWNKMHHGSFHLFGHVHGGLPEQPYRSMDIGIDTRSNGMVPYSWREVYRHLIVKPLKPHHNKLEA